MQRITALVSASLFLAACSASPQMNTVVPQNGVAPQNSVAPVLMSATTPNTAPVVIQKSPVLSQVKFAPEGRIQVKQSNVSVSIKLPALSDYADFTTQALDLSSAVKIVATVSDSHGETYTPTGADGNGKVDYPVNGELDLSFTGVVPDQLLFVELQVEDGTGNIPQAELAAVVSNTSVNDVNATVNFQTTPTAKAMKASGDRNRCRSRPRHCFARSRYPNDHHYRRQRYGPELYLHHPPHPGKHSTTGQRSGFKSTLCTHCRETTVRWEPALT